MIEKIKNGIIFMLFLAAAVLITLPGNAAVKKRSVKRTVEVNILAGTWVPEENNSDAASYWVFTSGSIKNIKFIYPDDGGDPYWGVVFAGRYKYSRSPLTVTDAALYRLNEKFEIRKLNIVYAIRDDILSIGIVPDSLVSEISGDDLGFADELMLLNYIKANPLTGTWNISGNHHAVFSGNKAVFIYRDQGADPQSFVEYKMEADFKFSKSPLILKFKDKSGIIQNLAMSYKIYGNKIIFRFLDTGSEAYSDVPDKFYQRIINRETLKKAVADFVGVKKEIRVENDENK